MICKVCGKEGPQTVGGICSEDCIETLKKQDRKQFKDELFDLLKKYCNSPYTLEFNNLKEGTQESLHDLYLVW
jgi:hypothetical protein